MARGPTWPRPAPGALPYRAQGRRPDPALHAVRAAGRRRQDPCRQVRAQFPLVPRRARRRLERASVAHAGSGRGDRRRDRRQLQPELPGPGLPDRGSASASDDLQSRAGLARPPDRARDSADPAPFAPVSSDPTAMITRPFGPTGLPVAVIGQGTWGMGERRAARKAELAALRLGIELGMTHIDTAEMYADGGAEEVVAEAVAGQRDRVFIATKVLPSNASYAGTIRACEQSLKRLRTDRVDLYLVHWWSAQHPIADTMKAMEELLARGLARFIGVSNFDVAQMKAAQAALLRAPADRRGGVHAAEQGRIPARGGGRHRQAARPHAAPGCAELPDPPAVALHHSQGRPARARAGERRRARLRAQLRRLPRHRPGVLSGRARAA